MSVAAQPLEEELRLPGDVHGRVVRADNGRPVKEATITVVRGAGPAPDIAPVTDDAGRFVFEGLPAGTWVLRAHGPTGEIGETTLQVSADSVVDTIIEVAAAETATPQ